MMEPSSLSFGSNLWDVLKVLGVLLRHLCARVCPLLFRLSLGRLLPLNLRNLCSGRTTRRKLGFLLCRLACRLLLHHLRITLGTLRGRQVLLVALVLFILILDVFLLRELTGKSTGLWRVGIRVSCAVAPGSAAAWGERGKAYASMCPFLETGPDIPLVFVPLCPADGKRVRRSAFHIPCVRQARPSAR